MNTNDIRPLAGVRVLELGNYIAAPTAGRMLADFGAEVIKVERPVTGDELRNWRLYSGDTSMLYRTINRNKKSIVLDLQDRARPADRARPRPALRCAAGELPARHAGEVGAGSRGTRQGQPGPGDHPHLRVRPDRAAVAAARIRRGRRGVRRPARTRRRPRPAAGADRRVDRRLDRRNLRRVRHRDGAVPARPRVESAAGAAGHRRRTERIHPVGDGVAGAGLPRLRRRRANGSAGGWRASRRATPTRAPTAPASSSQATATPSSSATCRPSAGPIWPPTRSCRPTRAAGDAATNSTPRSASGRSTTPATTRCKLLDAAGVPSGPIYTAADICADEQYAARNMIQHFDVDTGETEPSRSGSPASSR